MEARRSLRRSSPLRTGILIALQAGSRGRRFIVIGIEPGRIPGTAETDPAKIHQSVSRYLTPPEPAWEPTYHKYKTQNVLVISVARPAAGDRTAMFHGSTGDFKDGTIYVRRPGKSEVALSADLRRLEDRSRTAEPRDLALTLEVEGEATVPQLSYRSDWVEQWVARERRRLLKPFDPPPASPARSARDLPSELDPLGLGGMSTRDLRQSMLGQSLHDMNSQMSSALAGLSRFEPASVLAPKQHEEQRSEEEFRAEADAYLERCRSQLPAAIDALRSSTAASISLAVRNNSIRNFAGVVINLHIEGDVDGYDWSDQPPSLRQLVGRSPREFGPWTESLMPDHAPLLGRTFSASDYVRSHEPPPPRPRIGKWGFGFD